MTNQTHQIRLVQEARTIFGMEAALQLCEKYGLPTSVLDIVLPEEDED